MNYRRFENESDDELIYRITGDKDKIGTWKDVADILNKLLGTDYNESAFRKKRQIFDKMMNANQSKFVNSNTQLEEINEKIRELSKERIKLQTEKQEYSKWLRENARDELIVEKITEAINNLNPIDIPKYITPKHSKKDYLLCISDSHYGIEFDIKDIYGNTINKYSPEIFKHRMWDLLNKVVEIIKSQDIKELNVWDLGDGIESILRLNSQLMKLRYGIIDSSIRYANFLSEWLNELSKYTRIKFQMVMDSNHCQLRICNAPKNSFPEENLSKVMITLIKERLRNNGNIIIIENPTGMNYSQLSTYTVIGCHNENKNMENVINEIQRTYSCHLDYMITGHWHKLLQSEIGQNSEVISVRSIMGTNPYAVSINKSSNAGASLIVFEQCYGKVCEYSLKLN